MRQERKTNRRFIAIMLVLLAPLAIGLLLVTTMQHSGNPEIYRSSSYSTMGTRHDVSFWGAEYRSIIRLWDLETGNQIADWSVPLGSLRELTLSDVGDRFLYFDRDDKNKTKNRVVIGSIVDGPTQSSRKILLPGTAGINSIRWTDSGSKLIYTDRDNELWRYDIQTGDSETLLWDRPVNSSWHYWQSDTTLVSFSDKQKPATERSYQLIGNKLVANGPAVNVGPNGPWPTFFAGGTRMMLAGNKDKQCKLIDVATGETIRTIESDGRSVANWQCSGDNVICFYGNISDANAPRVEIQGAQVFDAETGELQHQTLFTHKGLGTFYVPSMQRYLAASPSFEIETFDLTGRKTTVAPDLLRWWWPARILFITLTIAWWLTWSLKLRRDRRSWQPFIDVAILHAIVFVCSGVRLWAYIYGPDWSGRLHVWESVAFLGTGLSIITWFLLWVIFGPQRWSIRVGAFVLGIAVVVGAIILIWDAGSDAGGYNAALALAQTLIGTFTQAIVQLGLLWLALLMNVRLCHTSDLRETNGVADKGRTSIRDLFLWLIAFGILFAIIRLRTIAIPQGDNLTQLATTGCVGGMIGVVTLWLGLGTRRSRFPFVLAGYLFAGWYFDDIGRMEVMHVGLAWIPMILVSAIAMRCSGYSLQRPVDRAQSPQATAMAAT